LSVSPRPARSGRRIPALERSPRSDCPVRKPSASVAGCAACADSRPAPIAPASGASAEPRTCQSAAPGKSTADENAPGAPHGHATTPHTFFEPAAFARRYGTCVVTPHGSRKMALKSPDTIDTAQPAAPRECSTLFFKENRKRCQRAAPRRRNGTEVGRPPRPPPQARSPPRMARRQLCAGRGGSPHSSLQTLPHPPPSPPSRCPLLRPFLLLALPVCQRPFRPRRSPRCAAGSAPGTVSLGPPLPLCSNRPHYPAPIGN